MIWETAAQSQRTRRGPSFQRCLHQLRPNHALGRQSMSCVRLPMRGPGQRLRGAGAPDLAAPPAAQPGHGRLVEPDPWRSTKAVEGARQRHRLLQLPLKLPLLVIQPLQAGPRLFHLAFQLL